MSAPDVSTGKAPAAGREPGRPGPKVIQGIVTSDKMQKTRSVQVMRLERHPKYGKFMRRHTTFKVHDEGNVSKEGDTVLIAETRPLSKTKRWRLIEVLAKSRYLLPVPGAEDSASREKASREKAAEAETDLHPLRGGDESSGDKGSGEGASAEGEAP